MSKTLSAKEYYHEHGEGSCKFREDLASMIQAVVDDRIYRLLLDMTKNEDGTYSMSAEMAVVYDSEVSYFAKNDIDKLLFQSLADDFIDRIVKDFIAD